MAPPTVLGYEVLASLGHGALGQVKLGFDPRTGEAVAIKLVARGSSSAQAETEVRALRALRGAPHVLQLLSAAPRAALTDGPREEEVMATVTGFAALGDLYELLHVGGAFSEAASKAIFRQVLGGLVALAERGVLAHRDVKPENVLVDGDGALRLADFHLCKCDGEPAAAAGPATLLRTSCGSARYMAPEVFAGGRYRGAPADAWSAACLLFTIVIGHPPLEEPSRRCWFFKKLCVERAKAPVFWRAHAARDGAPTAARPPADGGVSDDCRALLARALVADPARRATAEELLADAWFARGVPELTPAELRDELARRAARVPQLVDAKQRLAARQARLRAEQATRESASERATATSEKPERAGLVCRSPCGVEDDGQVSEFKADM